MYGDRRLALRVLAALALLPIACSEDNGNSVGDCDYARALDRSSRAFADAYGLAAGRDVTLGPQESVRIYDVLDTAMARLIDELQGLRLDRDMDRVNRSYISAYQEFRRRIPAMREAAGKGDAIEAGALLSEAGEDVAARGEATARDNADALRRLRRCK